MRARAAHTPCVHMCGSRTQRGYILNVGSARRRPAIFVLLRMLAFGVVGPAGGGFARPGPGPGTHVSSDSPTESLPPLAFALRVVSHIEPRWGASCCLLLLLSS